MGGVWCCLYVGFCCMMYAYDWAILNVNLNSNLNSSHVIPCHLFSISSHLNLNLNLISISISISISSQSHLNLISISSYLTDPTSLLACWLLLKKYFKCSPPSMSMTNARYGDLYMCLGSDENIGRLKHPPTIPENERR